MIDEVRSGGSFCSQNDLRVRFGLGPATQVDKIEIRWPDGSVETLKGIPGDQRIVIRQGKGLQSSEKLLPLPSIYKP
jgi:enediyne biosynthesis protein E4